MAVTETKSNLTPQTPRENAISSIRVDEFINRYGVVNPETQEALRRFPTLCYLLGKVTKLSHPRGEHSRDTSIPILIVPTYLPPSRDFYQ